MDARYLRILSKKCSETAHQTAQSICATAREQEVDFVTLVQQFQKLLPAYRIGKADNWQDAERVIARAYFILQTQELARNYYKS